MIKSLIFIIVLLFFSGCFKSLTIELKKDEVLEKEYVSFKSPSDDWYLIGDRKWVIQGKGKAQWITLYNSPKGTNYDIEVQTYPFKWMPIDILFDKDGNYEERSDYLQNTPETFARNKEQGISYSKDETQYVNGLKCLGSVFSRSHGGSLYSLTAKNYSVTCGYYDKTVKENDSKRILRVGYTYKYTGKNTRLQKDKDVKKDDMPSVRDIENNLKKEIKKLVSTIKIKNLDRDRMEGEGLIHYDKEFKSTKW